MSVIKGQLIDDWVIRSVILWDFGRLEKSSIRRQKLTRPILNNRLLTNK